MNSKVNYKNIKVINYTIKVLYLFLFGLINLYSYSVYGQPPPQPPPPNLGDVILNVASKMEQISDFLSVVAVVIGVTLVFTGLFKMKHLADMRNMMSGQADITKTLALILIGAFFIWSPFLIEALTFTLFSRDIGALQTQYQVRVADASLVPYYTAFIRILQVLGIISFLRGLFVFANMSKGQSQPGSFAKGTTHIISGILLINITAFMGVMRDTIGSSFSFGIS